MRNNLFKKIAGFIVVSVVLFFLLSVLLKNWQEIKNYHFSFNYLYLAFSFLCAICSIFLLGVAWNSIIRYLGFKQMSYGKSIEIKVFTNFAKYVPGKIWGVFGSVYLAKGTGVPRRILVYSYAIQTVTGVLAAVFWSSILLVFYFGGVYYFLLFSFFIFIVIFNQSIFARLINFFLKKAGKEKIPSEYFLNKKNLIKIFLLLSLVRFLNGFGFFLLLLSFYNISWSFLMIIVGVYVIANVSGYLALFAPAGIGVKEGMLLLLLTRYLPEPIAIFISLFSRLWLTISDILALLFFLFYKKIFLNKVESKNEIF